MHHTQPLSTHNWLQLGAFKSIREFPAHSLTDRCEASLLALLTAALNSLPFMLQNMWDLNSIFGTPEDLTSLVSAIHNRGTITACHGRVWPSCLHHHHVQTAGFSTIQTAASPSRSAVAMRSTAAAAAADAEQGEERSQEFGGRQAEQSSACISMQHS